MPAADPIRYREYHDFSGGLWQRGNDREVPPNGLLELTDAMPLQSGGLRAAMSFTTHTVANLPTGTTSLVKGFYVSPRTDFSINNLGDRIMYVMTGPGITTNLTPQSSNGPQLWVSTGRVSTASTGWALVSSWGDVTGGVGSWAHPTPFCFYFTTADGPRDYFAITDQTQATTNGIYKLSANGLAASQMSTAVVPFYMTPHQDRLACLTSGSFVQFTDPGTTVFSGSADMFVGPYIPKQLVWANSVYPSDLTLIGYPHGNFLLQGTLPSVLTREIALQTNLGNAVWPVSTPQGVVVPTLGEGVWLYSGGQLAEKVSHQFTGTPQLLTSLPFMSAGQPVPELFYGSVGYMNEWAFFPNGYVLDLRTRAWFRITLPAGVNSNNRPLAYAFWSPDIPRETMFAAVTDASQSGELQQTGTVTGGSGAGSGAVQIIECNLNSGAMPRASSYTFALPVAELPERNQGEPQTIVLRELNYYLQSYANGSQLKAEVVWMRPNGMSVTTPMPVVQLGSGLLNVRLQIGQSPGPINSRWVKVRTTLSAPQGSEAPTLERMRVGYIDGQPYGT